MSTGREKLIAAKDRITERFNTEKDRFVKTANAVVEYVKNGVPKFGRKDFSAICSPQPLKQIDAGEKIVSQNTNHINLDGKPTQLNNNQVIVDGKPVPLDTNQIIATDKLMPPNSDQMIADEKPIQLDSVQM